MRDVVKDNIFGFWPTLLFSSAFGVLAILVSILFFYETTYKYYLMTRFFSAFFGFDCEVKSVICDLYNIFIVFLYYPLIFYIGFSFGFAFASVIKYLVFGVFVGYWGLLCASLNLFVASFTSWFFFCRV